MYKTNETSKRLLQEKFEEVVNGYLLELCNMWELDPANGWFVGDEVGDVWCYGDYIFIGFDDMRYVVENDVSYETYDEWQEYCLWAKDFEQVVPNIKSWCMGCPRVDEATKEKLTAMRNELNELIKETKAKF